MRLAAFLALISNTAYADVVVPLQTIKAKTIITAETLAVRPETVVGAVSNPADAVGKESRVTLFAGRPIRLHDLTTAAVIERNQLVKLHYRANNLQIVTEGRALDRAAPGEFLQVMNLASRTTVIAKVMPDGSLTVENMSSE